jgi:NADH dehydrogenase/NADH:ubiquinone oxidoreductase subunit G
VRNNNCDLQNLADELGVRQRRYAAQPRAWKLDVSSPSLVRDPEKCILCGKCVRVCEEVQGVSAIDFIGRGSHARRHRVRRGPQRLELHQLRAVHHGLPDRRAA